jgi:hypothetical protein
MMAKQIPAKGENALQAADGEVESAVGFEEGYVFGQIRVTMWSVSWLEILALSNSLASIDPCLTLKAK